MTTADRLAAYHAAMQPSALRRAIADRYRYLRHWAIAPHEAIDAYHEARRDVLDAIARRRPTLGHGTSYSDRLAIIGDALAVRS